MDNITHSLAGLVLAEAAVQLRTGSIVQSARLRTVAAMSSMVAANLPDADLLYTGVGGDRLAYILHHRGHTHTVVVAIAGALLLWGCVLAIWRWRTQGAPTREDARWLAALIVVSTLGHIALDWTNSYGVHPFWPFDNQWRYGDFVFIVEPWLWVVAVPALATAHTNRVARAALWLVLVIGLVLAWRVDLVSMGAAVALTLGAVVSVLLGRTLRPRPRAATAIAAWVGVTLVMAASASAARRAATRAVLAADPTAELLDVVVTTLPANAVCMNVITVERSGAMYRVATARVSSAPRITAAARCTERNGAGSMFRASSRSATRAVQWDSEWTAPYGELSALARGSCPALAALRFIRVPAWRREPDSTISLGDVRYGGADGGFTSVRVPRRSTTCPDPVPPWTPPRADMLDR